MNIHPKVAGSAIGGTLGIILDGILKSIHGVHLDATVYGAIPTFFSMIGGWLAPAPEVSQLSHVTKPADTGFIQEPPVE